MSSKILVSVILPVFNVESYLEDCLKSLLNQNFKNFEIIAVNDGSTDNSLKILKSIAKTDARIRIISQPNKGLSSARNTGLMLAKGKYIQFVDSDDVVSRDLLSVCVSSFKTYNTNVLIFNHAEFEFNLSYHNDKIKDLPTGKIQNSIFYKSIQNISTSQWLPVWLYSYKKEFLDKYKLEFEEGIIHEDNLFTPLVIHYANELAIIPNKLYYYRKRQNSITNNSDNIEKSLNDQLFISQKLLKISEDTASHILFKEAINRLNVLLYNIEKNYNYKYLYIYNETVKCIRFNNINKRLINYSLNKKYVYAGKSFLNYPKLVFTYKMKPFLKKINSFLK